VNLIEDKQFDISGPIRIGNAAPVYPVVPIEAGTPVEPGSQQLSGERGFSNLAGTANKDHFVPQIRAHGIGQISFFNHELSIISDKLKVDNICLKAIFI
jgi:hypothetical protein